MTTANHYSLGDRAPIVEALVDLRALTETDFASLTELAVAVSDQLPTTSRQFSTEFRLDGAASAAGGSPTVPIGLLLHSAARDRAVQYQLQGMSVSHLRPYRDWAALVRDVRAHWARYTSAAGVRRVQRLGVRYINQLTVPGDDLTRWFEIRAEMPSRLGLPTVEVTARFAQRHPASGATCLVTFTATRSAEPAHDVVLDIDVFFDPVDLAPDDAAIWEKLEALHEVKNDVFFSAITADTVEWLRR